MSSLISQVVCNLTSFVNVSHASVYVCVCITKAYLLSNKHRLARFLRTNSNKPRVFNWDFSTFRCDNFTHFAFVVWDFLQQNGNLDTRIFKGILVCGATMYSVVGHKEQRAMCLWCRSGLLANVSVGVSVQLNALVAGNGSYILQPCGHDLHSPTSPFLC